MIKEQIEVGQSAARKEEFIRKYQLEFAEFVANTSWTRDMPEQACAECKEMFKPTTGQQTQRFCRECGSPKAHKRRKAAEIRRLGQVK